MKTLGLPPKPNYLLRLAPLKRKSWVRHASSGAHCYKITLGTTKDPLSPSLLDHSPRDLPQILEERVAFWRSLLNQLYHGAKVLFPNSGALSRLTWSEAASIWSNPLFWIFSIIFREFLTFRVGHFPFTSVLGLSFIYTIQSYGLLAFFHKVDNLVVFGSYFIRSDIRLAAKTVRRPCPLIFWILGFFEFLCATLCNHEYWS